MTSSGAAAGGSPEDRRAASNLVTTLSGYLITAALAVLGAQAIVATFVIDRREHLTAFYAVSSAGTSSVVLSVILGGAGIYEIVSAGFQGRWKIATVSRRFNLQATLVLLGTVLVVWSAFLGDTVRTQLHATGAPPATPDKCGVERWAVKTMSDRAAKQVRLAVQGSSVKALRRIAKPRPPIGKNDPRRASEKVVYGIEAELVAAKKEDDRDIHLVVAEPGKPRLAMIVEFVDVTCPGARGSRVKAKMAKATERFIADCGQIPQRFVGLKGTATISGVAFFDVIHGQRGHAPNGIELHPALSYQKGGGCQRR